MTIKDAARQLDINDKNVNKIFRFYHEEQKTQKSLIRFQLRILARELLNIKLFEKARKWYAVSEKDDWMTIWSLIAT